MHHCEASNFWSIEVRQEWMERVGDGIAPHTKDLRGWQVNPRFDGGSWIEVRHVNDDGMDTLE